MRRRRYGAPFLKALEESGFVDGRNVMIDYRFSEGRDESLPMLAAELVRRLVAVLVASDRPSALAAKAATATIPIVFTSGREPIEAGLVASLARPGTNATGVSVFTTEQKSGCRCAWRTRSPRAPSPDRLCFNLLKSRSKRPDGGDRRVGC